MTPPLARVDRAIINGLQGGFPVGHRPFEHVARAFRQRGVDVVAEDLIDRVARLRERDVISRFGPILNANAIGGRTTLVAMAVPEDRFDAVAERVNADPAVAHNYKRDHGLNMWFVLSVVDSDRIDTILERLQRETGLEPYRFPKHREFYLGARFPVDGPFRAEGLDLADDDGATEPSDPQSSLDGPERDLIVALQDGLPITAAPYTAVAATIGRGADWTRERIADFRASGVIRRVGVVPNHYALGYTANGMTVWNVPDHGVRAVGSAVGRLPFVTHCYERPRHPDVWPYNLFAMVHGRTEAELSRKVDRVEAVVGDHVALTPDDWDMLMSTRMLKKTGLRLAERVRASSR